MRVRISPALLTTMTEPNPPSQTVSEQARQEPSWLKDFPWVKNFLREHPTSELPERISGAFEFLLKNAEGVRDYYKVIPEERFDVGIGQDHKGDSPRKQLIHEIGITRLRTESIKNGVLEDWNYEETNPDGFAKLSMMSRSELIDQLDSSIVDLYEATKDEENLNREITLPNGEKTDGFTSVIRVQQHKILHLGISISAADCIGGISRPRSVQAIYG